MRERKELLFRSARTRKVVGAVLALFSKPRGADVEITCMVRNQYCNGERYTVRIDGQARQREGEGGREGGRERERERERERLYRLTRLGCAKISDFREA